MLYGPKQWIKQQPLPYLQMFQCPYYLIFFLCASIILLIAMIGSIVLTMHKGVFVKRQDVFEQNTRDFSKTLQKIKTI